MPTALTSAQLQNKNTHTVDFRFIEPGMARYADKGDVLVQKAALDKFAQSLVGCPIFNAEHYNGTIPDDIYKNGEADGIVNSVYFDAQDGWYHFKGIVWDKPTIQNIKKGYACSCAYSVKQWGNGGVHNNVPFDKEVLDGEYEHVAIVNNPRYEGATKTQFLYNSKEGTMKIKFWEKDKKDSDAPTEIDLEKANVLVNDKEIPFAEVIKLAEAEQKRKDEELANSKNTLKDDQIVEIAGKKMTVKEAKELASAQLANNVKNEMEKDHKDGKHDEKELKDCGMCNKRKNETEEKEKEEKEEKERENKRKNQLEGRTSFDALEQLANSRSKNKDQAGDLETVPFTERPSGFKKGAEIFGAPKQEANKN